jgi:tetratricopeptide (TPR) repeat protein
MNFHLVGDYDNITLAYAQQSLAESMCNSGDDAEAVSIYEKAIGLFGEQSTLNPKDQAGLWATRFNLSLALIRLGRYPEAENILLDLKSHSSGDGDSEALSRAFFHLYSQTGRQDEASEAADRLIELALRETDATQRVTLLVKLSKRFQIEGDQRDAENALAKG